MATASQISSLGGTMFSVAVVRLIATQVQCICLPGQATSTGWSTVQQ